MIKFLTPFIASLLVLALLINPALATPDELKVQTSPLTTEAFALRAATHRVFIREYQSTFDESVRAFMRAFRKDRKLPQITLEGFRLRMEDQLVTYGFKRETSVYALLQELVESSRRTSFTVSIDQLERIGAQAYLTDFLSYLSALCIYAPLPIAKKNLQVVEHLWSWYTTLDHPFASDVVQNAAESIQFVGSIASPNEEQQLVREHTYLRLFADSKHPNPYPYYLLPALARHFHAALTISDGPISSQFSMMSRNANSVDYPIALLGLRQALRDYLRYGNVQHLGLLIAWTISGDPISFTSPADLRHITPEQYRKLRPTVPSAYFFEQPKVYPRSIARTVQNRIFQMLFDSRHRLLADMKVLETEGRTAVASLFGQRNFFSTLQLARVWASRLYDPHSSAWVYRDLNRPHKTSTFIAWLKTMDHVAKEFGKVTKYMYPPFDPENGWLRFEETRRRLTEMHKPRGRISA